MISLHRIKWDSWEPLPFEKGRKWNIYLQFFTLRDSGIRVFQIMRDLGKSQRTVTIRGIFLRLVASLISHKPLSQKLEKGFAEKKRKIFKDRKSRFLADLFSLSPNLYLLFLGKKYRWEQVEKLMCFQHLWVKFPCVYVSLWFGLFFEEKGHNLYQLFKTYHALVFSLSDILYS